jgi:hypothetical protein
MTLTANPARLAAIFAVTALLHAAPATQSTFSTPQEAAQALIAASENNDSAALLKIFGPGGKDIAESGDPASDKEHRAHFATLAHEKMGFVKDPSDPSRTVLFVGNEDWPFPVPLAEKDGKWRFDSARGKIEVLARRIGRNEMNALQVVRGFAEAEFEYAAVDHDKDGILEYAQKIVSTQGKQDGLYWAGATIVPQSFAMAAESWAQSGQKREPYHGYYYKVLKAQGPDAEGGALDYVVKGEMIGGFALVAWPAEYGVSGIHTFIVNHHCVVYEKDMGANTSTGTRQMTRFNPDKSWRQAEKD